jgi:hypothetical protein
MKTIKQPDTATITIDKATHETIKNLARLDDRSVKSWLKREFLGMNPIRKPTESTQKPTRTYHNEPIQTQNTTQKPTEHDQQGTNKLLEDMYKDDVNLLEDSLKDTLEEDDLEGWN